MSSPQLVEQGTRHTRPNEDWARPFDKNSEEWQEAVRSAIEKGLKTDDRAIAQRIYHNRKKAKLAAGVPVERVRSEWITEDSPEFIAEKERGEQLGLNNSSVAIRSRITRRRRMGQDAAPPVTRGVGRRWSVDSPEYQAELRRRVAQGLSTDDHDVRNGLSRLAKKGALAVAVPHAPRGSVKNAKLDIGSSKTPRELLREVCTQLNTQRMLGKKFVEYPVDKLQAIIAEFVLKPRGLDPKSVFVMVDFFDVL